MTHLAELRGVDILAANRIRIAGELWEAYLAAGQSLVQLDRWLAATLKNDRRFGKKDRAFYADTLFACARFGVWLVEKNTNARAPESALELRKTLQKFATGEFVSAALELAKSPQDGEILAKTISPSLARDLSTLATRLGPEQMQKWTIALHERPPLWIRANCDPAESVFNQLQAEGYQVERTSDQTALISGNAKSLFTTESFQAGKFEIQDLASQMIGDAIPLGATMWDCCAGQGGKTIQLASRSKGKGAIFASDIREHSLEQLKVRAKRAQLYNIRTFTWDATRKVKLPREASVGFDVVVVDAPCSGSGTWRRNPDGKLRTDSQVVDEFIKKQAEILQTAASAVKKGGTLVYATCSAFDCENFAQVATFLKNNPSFSLQSAALNGSPWLDADTTFVAVMGSGT